MAFEKLNQFSGNGTFLNFFIFIQKHTKHHEKGYFNITVSVKATLVHLLSTAVSS